MRVEKKHQHPVFFKTDLFGEDLVMTIPWGVYIQLINHVANLTQDYQRLFQFFPNCYGGIGIHVGTRYQKQALNDLPPLAMVNLADHSWHPTNLRVPHPPNATGSKSLKALFEGLVFRDTGIVNNPSIYCTWIC